MMQLFPASAAKAMNSSGLTAAVVEILFDGNGNSDTVDKLEVGVVADAVRIEALEAQAKAGEGSHIRVRDDAFSTPVAAEVAREVLAALT